MSSVSPVNTRSSTRRHIESAVLPGRVHRLQRAACPSTNIRRLQPQVDEGRGAGAMHDDRHAELARQLLGCREMVGVRVRSMR